MRRAPKTDTVQADIVAALERVGCRVAIMAGVGKGFPDLVVRCRGHMAPIILMECKSGKRGKLTPQQVRFLSEWPETIIARTVEDALRAVGVRI